MNPGLRGAPRLILAGSTATLFITAFSYSSYSIFEPSFLQDFHAAHGEAALPFSLAMVTWGVMQPVVGAISDARGTRPLILSGVILAAIGFLIMGLSQALWQVAIGFGIFIGLATSSAGSIMFALLISKWFPGARRGSAVGFVQGAQPASPMILAPLAFFIITTFGWRVASFSMAGLLLVVAFPLAYFNLHDPKMEMPRAKSSLKDEWRGAVNTIWRISPLRYLFISRFACGLSFLLIPHLAAFALGAGLTAGDGALAVSLYGASGAVGSFAGGFLADRLGRVPTLIGTYVVRGFGSIILALFATNNAPLFFLGVVLAAGPIFATVGINNVQAFELTKGRNAGLITGIGFVLHQIAAALGPVLGGIDFDMTGSYRISLLALAAVLLLATIPAAFTGLDRAAPRPTPTGQPVDLS